MKPGLTKIIVSQKPDEDGKWFFSAAVQNNGERKMYKCVQSGSQKFLLPNFFVKLLLTLFWGIPRDFQKVMIYASDPWYEPADVNIISEDFRKP